MIIVYTDNGSCCINDAAVEKIVFLREEKEVRIWPLHADMGPGMPFQTITDVQQVVYNVQAEPRAINDSCEEIVHLRKMKVYTDRLRAFIFKLQDKNPELWEEIDREVKQERPKLFIDEQDKSKPSD
jgi:hypothetical protein